MQIYSILSTSQKGLLMNLADLLKPQCPMQIPAFWNKRLPKSQTSDVLISCLLSQKWYFLKSIFMILIFHANKICTWRRLIILHLWYLELFKCGFHEFHRTLNFYCIFSSSSFSWLLWWAQKLRKVRKALLPTICT